ncbi:hypothetical protein BROUX41_001217 [Berkeleyomyces rouxiae]
MYAKPLLTTESGELLSPEKPFDPKAVTRESWKKPKPRPARDGPYISFNVHPDAYVQHYTGSKSSWRLSNLCRQAMKWTRILQLVLRVLQAVAAIGVLGLFIAFIKLPATTSWIFRIAGGVASLHCTYSAYHHFRSPVGRSPASTAAYQFFSVLADASIVGVYSYGVVTVNRDGRKWATRLDASSFDTMVLAAYYGLISAAATHFVSLGISVWLSIIFRRISQLPPDMNPLETSLTTRQKRHRKNRSSVGSTLSTSSIRKDIFGASEAHSISPNTLDGLESPRRTVPFLDTLPGSPESSRSRKNSLVNLPDRQYQIVPSNANVDSPTEYRRPTAVSMKAGSYAEVPSRESSPTKSRPPTTYYARQDVSPAKSRPGTGYSSSRGYDMPLQAPSLKSQVNTSYNAPLNMSPTKSRPTTAHGSPRSLPPRPTTSASRDMSPSPSRTPKVQEAWSSSNTFIGRAQKRINGNGTPPKKSYEALHQRYDDSDSEDMMANSDFEGDGDFERGHGRYRNPLRRNPVAPSNDLPSPPPPHGGKLASSAASARSDKGPAPTGGASSSKPYGVLGQGADAIPVGSSRQVSSGNDYEVKASTGFGRRHVSGKVAEEGRVLHLVAGYTRLSEM